MLYVYTFLSTYLCVIFNFDAKVQTFFLMAKLFMLKNVNHLHFLFFSSTFLPYCQGTLRTPIPLR